MATVLLYAQRLTAFHTLVARIERQFAAGHLSPAERRAQLIAARDDIGIDPGPQTPENRVPRGSLLTEDEARARTRRNDKRHRHDQAGPTARTCP
jgi:hypothetical protein